MSQHEYCRVAGWSDLRHNHLARVTMRRMAIGSGSAARTAGVGEGREARLICVERRS
jgi:hypothetical protein